MKMDSAGYKLFLVDLDGTLIDGNEKMSPRVSRAVAKASASLHVSIATGREPDGAIPYARQLGLTAPQISDGGANVFDPTTGKSLWTAPLSQENVEEILAEIRGIDVALFATYPGGTITRAEDTAGRDLTRVSLLDVDGEMADRLLAMFAKNPALNVVKVFLPYNRLWAVDITRDGVNKGTATRWVAERLGVESDQMIAIGDSYNDLPLLEACGLRIAMSGAPEELKALAHYVAPPVEEDGVAVAIEEYILPRLQSH